MPPLSRSIIPATSNVVDNNNNAKISYTYSDFGETEEFGDTDFYNEIAYTGGIYDESTSLYYLNARYYNPEDARFITMDTYRGEKNKPETLYLYTYCANNPINYIDPSGHWVTAVSIEGSISIIFSVKTSMYVAVDNKGYMAIAMAVTYGVEISNAIFSGAGFSVAICFYPTLKSVDNLSGSGFSAGATLDFAVISVSGGVSIAPNTIAGYGSLSKGLGSGFKLKRPKFSVYANYTNSTQSSKMKITTLLNKPKDYVKNVYVRNKKIKIKNKKSYLEISYSNRYFKVYKDKKIFAKRK